MKYCLSSRQKQEYLKKADSIKVAFRDRNIIPDLIEKYPNAEIVVLIHREKDEKFNWSEMKMWGILARGRLVCCLQNLMDVEECKNANLPFYWGYPVNNYYDLRALKDLGVAYVRLDAPLFFEMDEVKKFDIPVRAVPNVAHLGDIPNKNGIFGTWIRPEDIEFYENYVAICEFENCDLNKEATLFQAYQNEEWNAGLNILLYNFNMLANNNLIWYNSLQKRLNCGQKCQKNGKCTICNKVIELASNYPNNNKI